MVHIRPWVSSKRLRGVHTVPSQLVSPPDRRLPPALEAVRSKLGSRVRSECLQSAYKIALGCQHLNLMFARVSGRGNLLDRQIRPTLIEGQIDLLLSLSRVRLEMFRDPRLALWFRSSMYSVETTLEGASP